jgi:hypothetical protein
MSPPCASTSFRAMERPRPEPLEIDADVAEVRLYPRPGAQGTGEANFDIQAAQLSEYGNLLGNTTSITETDSDEKSPAVSTAGSTRVFAYSRASADGGDRLVLRFDDDGPRRRSVRH